jgi:hypothetical protein
MSSYSGTAPVGDPKATGAYAVAIAAQAGGTNNNNHSTDSAGNLVVDRAWGHLPLQPNDERRVTATNIGGTNGGDAFAENANGEMRGVPGKGADTQWSATTAVTGGNLAYGDFAVTVGNNPTRTAHTGIHTIAETGYASFPAYTAAQGNFMVTAASGDGTTITYTSLNFLRPGDVVNITGVTTSGFNLSSATVASATRASFTVTNSACSGVSLTGQVAKAEYATALSASDGTYIAGVDYVIVPNVLGETTALATNAMTDAELVPTTATAATNTPISITAAARTALSSTATVTAAGAGAAFPVGTKITIAGLADATTTELDGTWTVTANATNTVSFVSNATTAIAVASPTGTPTVKGTTGTIKTQSVAANAASISATTAVTITPWA